MGCHTCWLSFFFIGITVVRTDGRVGGRSVYGHVITKFCRMGRLPHFLSYGARRAWSSSITTWSFIIISKVFVESHDCSPYSVHSVKAELESILPLIAIWQKSTYKLKLWRNTKKGTNIKGKTILFELQSSTDLKNFTDSTQSAKKKKVFEDKVFTNQEKNAIFPFHQYWKTNTCQDRNNFQGANYVNLHYGSKTLKFEDIVRLKVMLHETIRNNDLLAQQSVATLLWHCFERLQYCSNIAAQCCAKNRRCTSSRVKSSFGSGSLKGSS